MENMDILRAAIKHRMFSQGDRVLAAVSGGPDSVAMLHALHTHSAEFGIRLYVAHLNHQIRGEESNLDEVFVHNLAHSFGLEAIIRRVDVPSLREELGMGVEEAARFVRYKFLRDTSTELGANKIAVGHNADDRVESVLLNVIRGAGISGLGSIRPIRGNIVRPLLDTPRKEIEQYIKENALPFRIDESNMDTSYARNRIRHELIPLLEQDYNPAIREALVKLAEIAGAQNDLITDLANAALNEIRDDSNINPVHFLDLHKALQYQVIRAEIERLKGNLLDVGYEHVERVIEALRSGEDFTITLPSGLIYAERRGDKFSIRKREKLPEIEPFDVPLPAPGSVKIELIGLNIQADIIDSPTPGKLPPDEALIDADSITGQLRIRSIHPGDRIVPLGMQGSKKLQDIFVDKKISKSERTRAAVVVDDEKVLWVVGVVSSERGKVTDKTRRAIHLRSERN